MLFLPWFTLFFLKKDAVKSYMPVGILASFMMAVYNTYASNQNHWEIKTNIIPSLKPLFVPGIFGVFIITTIWIFYFTYGNFLRYLLTNIVADFMFAIFPIHYLLQEKWGIYELVNITRFERFGLFVTFSVILYGFQMWLEGIFMTDHRKK